MKALEEKILKEGKVLPGNILKVGSFLNQMLDVPFIMSMGEEIARLFEGFGVNKILTIESSGISIAFAAATKMNVPVVVAKKGKSKNVDGDIYSAEIYSFTHQKTYDVVVSKDYIGQDDKVLVVDDFLAGGNALNGVIKILEEAGAALVGCAVAIEKGFQGGGDKLREKGIKVEALALVDSMSDTSLTFRK